MSGRGRKRFLPALIVLTALSSCTRKVLVPVENTATRTDTLVQTQLRVDSFYEHDSVAVYISGDTVRLTRYRDRFRYRNLTDTVYRSVTDTARIAVPYPVERKLTRWERIKQEAGGIALGALALVAIAVAVLWLIKKFRK